MGLYKAGTIAISTAGAATGTGTAWTTAGTGIRTGQTILVNTNPAQQFTIQAINNATSLTLSPNPTAAIAAGTTYAILTTDALSVDGLGSQVAEAITYFKTSLNDRAAAGANADITSLGGLTTPLSIGQGGTGANAASVARTNLGAAGINFANEFQGIQTFNDVLRIKPSSSATALAHLWFYDLGATQSRGLVYAAPASTGRISIRPDSTAGDGYSCTFDTAGKITCASLTQTSDARSKKVVEQVTGALAKLGQIRGLTYSLRVTENQWVDGAGVLAQELEAVLPCAVTSGNDGFDTNGNKITDAKSVDYSALSALYVEAFREVAERLEALEKSLPKQDAEKTS